MSLKTESFIVLMVIAWTYLLHAYYRSKKVEYRYYEPSGGRRQYKRTKRGAFLYWKLERCLNDSASPIDKDTANNLRFLIGLRHEIEHQMCRSLDAYLTGRYQACCLNYNHYIKHLFGEKNDIEQHLSYSIQFAELSYEQVASMPRDESIPQGIINYISSFDEKLSEEEFNNSRFSYRLIFERKLAGKRGQADKVIEFIKSDSEEALTISKDKWVKQEVEKPKYLAGDVVRKMKEEGSPKFTMHYHTMFWKDQDGKNPGKGYRVQVARTWYWYDRWLDVVRDHCSSHSSFYQ